MFDLLFTAFNYEKRDKEPNKCQSFFDKLEGKFLNPFVQKLVHEINEQRKIIASETSMDKTE